MAIYTYILRYDGVERSVTAEETISVNKQVRLQRPADDRIGSEEFSVWCVNERKDEMREVFTGKLQSVVVLDLVRVGPAPTAVPDYVVHG